MIVITNGTSPFGRLVVQHRLQHVPAGEIAVTPERSRMFLEPHNGSSGTSSAVGLCQRGSVLLRDDSGRVLVART